MIEIQVYSAYKVIEIALSKAKFHPFHIIWMQLKCVDYLEHKEEGRRRTISFFVFLLRQLPVSHYIPHDLILIDWRLL
jgi:hypothetical protein